ncbi:hypothetical protein GCM10009545_10550 [Saccharopolyspora thermophila]|uniref:Uncharacterized protein n=1 Tax=Saccharopolyspora thermophila TaxID=89367 RepID=A0ABN1C2W6_9PSEU
MIVLLLALFTAVVGGLVVAYHVRSPGRHAGSGVGAFNARTLAPSGRKPGALPSGYTITAMGGCDLKIPWPTPYGQLPASALVTDQCPDCHMAVVSQGLAPRTWDY